MRRGSFHFSKTVLLALAALLANAYPLWTRLYEKSYDAFTHLFFASHYAQSWFNPWNPKWYGGFDQTSYPPLCHQTLALLSPFVGLESAYLVLQALVIISFITGVYRFSMIWLSEADAFFAAMLGIFLTSTAQAAYQFGQMPTLFAIGFLLHAAPFLYQWLRGGRILDLWLCLTLIGIVTTSHHLTFVLGSVFFLLPAALSALTPPDWLKQKGGSILKSFQIREGTRLTILGAASAAVFIFLLMPFIHYLIANAVTQAEIPHGSRNNYLENWSDGFNFFVVPQSYLLMTIPFLLALPRFKGRGWLLASWAVLMILGLGGRTTPLPKILFGKLFYTLTFDRFCLWASVIALPLTAAAFSRSFLRWLRLPIICSAAGCFIWLIAMIRTTPFQPEPMDLTRLVDFLKQSDYANYRYLTLGFGSQMGRLGYLTDAANLDGNYHTARTIPKLRESGMETLDSAKYFPQGLDVLAYFLKDPGAYHLRFLFSKDPFYNDLLIAQKWRVLKTYRDGLQIWAHDAVPPIANDASGDAHSPFPLRLLWGAYPLLYVLLFLLLSARITRNKETEKQTTPLILQETTA